MDRVHISTGSIIFFFPLNTWQKRQYGDNKVLFQQLLKWDDIQPMSRHSASQSSGMKNPPNPSMSIRNLTNEKPELSRTSLQWRVDSKLSLRGKGKKRTGPGSMESYWSGNVQKGFQFHELYRQGCHRYYCQPNLICFFPI